MEFSSVFKVLNGCETYPKSQRQYWLVGFAMAFTFRGHSSCIKVSSKMLVITLSQFEIKIEIEMFEVEFPN